MGMTTNKSIRVCMGMGMLAVMLVMDHGQVNGEVAQDKTGIQPILDTSHQRAIQKNPADPLAKGKGLNWDPDAQSILNEMAGEVELLKEQAVINRGASANTKKYPVTYIFFNTVLMSLASGLGAIPFFFVKKLSKEVIGLANAIACGVMLACSFDLVHEGEPYGSTWVIFGIAFGMLFVHLSEKHLSRYEDVKFESLKGAPARKVLLVIGIMTAHAIGEGSGVGVAYSGKRGWAQGVLVTLAIGLHNIPEGLAVATVMIARGVPVKSAIWWTIMTAMPQAVVALPSYLFVESFTATLPIAMGFAAGSMIWVVFAELVPDALEDVDHGTVATTITLSAAWLEGLRMALSTLETPDGVLTSPIQADLGTLSSVTFALAPVAAIQCVICFFVKKRMQPSPWILGSFLGVLIVQLGAMIFQNSAKGGGTDSSILWALLGVAVGIGIYAILPQQTTSNEVGRGTGEESDPPQDLPITWPPGTQPGKLSGLSLLLVSSLILLSVCVGLQLASGAAWNLDRLDYIIMPGLIGGILLGWIAGVGVLFLPLSSEHSSFVALIFGSLPAICAILSLLPYPIGTASEPGAGSVTNNPTKELSFFLYGLLSVCMLSMLHGVLSVNYRQARNGCIAGFVVASFVQCILGGLCIGTPYCL